MLKAVGDNILIRRSEVKDKIGSIYVADVAKEKPAEGMVLSVGNSISPFNEGDLVIFGQYAGVEVEYKDETLLLVREKDILAIKED